MQQHRPLGNGQVITMMRTTVTTDHYRCLLHHAAPQRLRLRPAALGSQFIGFVFALFAASRVYDRALKICDDLKFKP